MRIRLLGSKKNKERGFYILMCNFKLQSFVMDEFIVDDKASKLLDKEKIKYKVIG